MVRVARHEVTRTETAQVGNLTAVKETQHIVAGCNTDALGKVRAPASCRCIGDQCAMWRWGEDHPMRRIVHADVFNHNGNDAANFVLHEADELEDEPARYIETTEAADARRRGYCGLAHRPNY